MAFYEFNHILIHNNKFEYTGKIARPKIQDFTMYDLDVHTYEYEDHNSCKPQISDYIPFEMAITTRCFLRRSADI